MAVNISEVVANLRREGSDHESVEAKSAAAGFPSRLAESICAFANRPGGGLLILGLDENAGFAANDVYDVALCKQSLMSLSRRAVTPKVSLTVETVLFEGHKLVCAEIGEANPTQKPIRVRSGGRAYLRCYDSNYVLSEMEEQVFVSGRTEHTYDAQPVPNADPQHEFDKDQLVVYLASRRASSRRFDKQSDEEILMHTGVLTFDGQITLAGMLMLGFYPQRVFPGLALQVHDAPSAQEPNIRSNDMRIIGGPISAIIDDALSWVARNTNTTLVNSPDGHVRNVPIYPRVAVRELIANALIHRDLSPYSRGVLVTLRLDAESLTITNAGSLYGIAIENLGNSPSHPRNHTLADIATQVQTADGERVIERMGTGMTVIADALAAVGSPPAQFYDNGLRFTAKLLDRRAVKRKEGSAGQVRHAGLSSNQAAIIKLLVHSDMTRQEITQATDLSRRQTEYALQMLREAGLVHMKGSAGETATYRATPTAAIVDTD